MARSQQRRFMQRSGRIMFPSSHDITPKNIEECVAVLRSMVWAGNTVLIVSKPDPDCIRRLCRELLPFKDSIMFRFTIGSADDAVLKYWEPGSPAYAQRIAALRHAHEQGFATSVSCEPMLDDKVDAVIEAVHPCVTDAIWLGKANHIRQMVTLNSPGDQAALRRAKALVALQNDDAIKKLYNRFKTDPLIKWKDSIKRVIGIERPTLKGLDI